MAGDERQLRYELLDAARGRKPRTDFWNRDQGLDAYFSGAGSQNIWLMCFATQALMDRQGFRSGHSGGDLELARAVYAYQLGPAAVGLPADATTVSPAGAPLFLRPGFGGSEFMSTIYWPWHFMSHVALCRCKDPQVAAWARRWVILNWALFRAITGPDGRLMLFGQRSAGHDPKPREMDWVYALASGGDLKRAEAWCRAAGAGLGQSWEKEIALELRPELQATWQESLAIRVEALPGLLPLRVPTEIVRTSEGIAVVHARNCNPNTPPILAGTLWTDGRRDVLPTSYVVTERKKGKLTFKRIDFRPFPGAEVVPGGIRIRQKFDHGSARIEGAEIVYGSPLYTGGEEVRVPLPGGETIYHLRLGSGSSGGAAAPPVDVQPPPASTPLDTPPPNLRMAADLLAGLQLAAKDRGRRDAIVAALRAGQDPEPYLPVIRAWFRPDSPQIQAAQWREALAILERAS